MPIISVILGYRNRDIERVRRCLESFNNQIYKNFEVVFIDYGSDERYRIQIKRLTGEYSFCNYFFSNTAGRPWNRSHALNIGLRMASGEYVVFGDIDIIYSKNYFKKLIEENEDNTHIYNPCYWLPQGFNNWELLQNHMIEDEIKKTCNRAARGGAHFIKKELLMRIGGYDEFYCFWGVEDRDLSTRLAKIGLKEKWLGEGIAPIYHQWHPVSFKSDDLFPDKWWEEMNIYYSSKKDVVNRNNENWGEIAFNREIFHRERIKNFNYKKYQSFIDNAGCIDDLINSIKVLNKDEKLRIIINDNRRGCKKTTVWFEHLKRLINFIMPDYYENRREIDLFFIIWKIIRTQNIINDYEIKYENGLKTIYIC